MIKNSTALPGKNGKSTGPKLPFAKGKAQRPNQVTNKR